jgi:hypothetical protein
MTGVALSEQVRCAGDKRAGRAVTLVIIRINKEKSGICVGVVKTGTPSRHPFGGKTPGAFTR